MIDWTSPLLLTAYGTLGGVMLTTVATTATAWSTRRHEFRKEIQRTQLELQKLQHLRVQEQSEKAHILVSILQRLYSLPFLTMYWKANLSVEAWDNKYAEACKQADKLRMIASMSHPSATEFVEGIYSEMGLCWGHFRTFLHRQQEGDDVDIETAGYREAFDAVNKISTLAKRAKAALSGANVSGAESDD